MLQSILNQLSNTSSTNAKLAILKEHSSNEDLQLILKATYDKVAYNFYINKQLEYIQLPQQETSSLYLIDAIHHCIKTLSENKLRGIQAIEFVQSLYNQLSKTDAIILTRVLERDLKIGVGRTQINKVFKNLITKPAYMRCDIFSAKTAKNIKFPALLQIKLDGTYREFMVQNNQVTCRSRAGESYEYPLLFSVLQNLQDGVYIGELTLVKDGKTLDRQTGNGILNSDNYLEYQDQIHLGLWDFISLEEYQSALLRQRTKKTPYFKRLEQLKTQINHLHPNINLVETQEVQSIEQALQITSSWMNQGFEGAILKDTLNEFKDGTSKHQLKLKTAFSVDVRITGFIEGTKGTKREATFGAIAFESDDGLIKGQTSGFSDALLEDFNSRRNELIGTIMEVEANDLVKSKENEYYALSHPRFIELRTDKNTTDTLERAKKSLEMAKTL